MDSDLILERIKNREWQGVLEYWFYGDLEINSKQKWFASSGTPHQEQADIFVQDNFSDILEQALQGNLEYWKWCSKGYLAWIIVMDQFTRHIYRHESNREELLKISDECALAAAKDLLAQGFIEDYSIHERIFILMPLRHQATEENMKEVLQHIEKMESLSATSNSLITRFRRATTKRLHGVSSNTDVLDILEREEVENDESDILKWPIIKTMKTFLQENGISSCNHVIVSLSGGVDSMVIAYILTKLKEQYNFEVICIHIDYGNREEACVEAEYLENWCNRHNMIFRCRKITEIKRGVTKRDEYEKLSREIRFNTYQEVMNEFKNCSGVMLGHHKGDIQENVVSNMMKGCTLLNLSGMHRIQVISGVGIWRPLLPHPKSDILDFAHRYGVSYFKDTTPRWSNRGRLRNEVLPLVSDVWGDGFRHNLSTLASESEEFALLINTKIFDPFMTKVTRTSVGVTIPVEEYKDQSSLFWKEAFKRVCEKVLGVPRIREKAVGNFIFKLGHKKTKPGFISMRQEFKSFLDSNNGTLTFFHPEFFPLKSKKRANFDLDPYVADGFEILPEVEYKFGPWKVFVGREDIACLGEEERVKLNNILTGSFSYCLPAYENPEYEIRAQLKARFYDFFQSIPRQIIHAIPVIKAKENGKRREDLCYRIQLTFQP